MAPRVPALDRLSARSVCSLVYRGPRLLAPSSRRDHAGQSLSTRRCAVPCRGSGFWWQVVGKGRAHARVRGTPLHPEGCRGMERLREGGGGLPVPPASRLPPVPSVACVPLSAASTSWPLPRRGRAARGACCVALGLVRLSPRPPLSSAAFPRPVESREPSSPPRGSGGSVSRGVDLALGGRLFWENGGWAASGASSDVGTRCRSRVFVGWHRCLHRSSLAPGVSPGSRGSPLFRVGSAPQVWWDCSRELCAV